MKIKLRPLPVENVNVDGLWEEKFGPYDAGQMRAYAAQCVRDALEAAAKECEFLERDCHQNGNNVGERIANAGAFRIRRLAQEVSE